jgi:hypothetical protein
MKRPGRTLVEHLSNLRPTLNTTPTYQGIESFNFTQKPRRNSKKTQKPTYKVSPYIHKIEEKSCIYTNQGWKPIHQKYKVKESTCKHKPKKKQKPTMTKNKVRALSK